MLFFVNINYLQVTVPLGRGFEIYNGIYLLNDERRINRLLSHIDQRMMGLLEYQHAVKTECAIYSENSNLADSVDNDDYAARRVSTILGLVNTLAGIR